MAYSQGNKTADPLSIKAMTRYMSTKYPNKNSGHQHKGKKGDRNREKENDPSSEDQDNNATDITGAHIVDVTTPEDSTAPSGGASIGAHVSKVTKQLSRPTRSVEDILGAYFINDAIWGGSHPYDVSVDTANSEEVMHSKRIELYQSL